MPNKSGQSQGFLVLLLILAVAAIGVIALFAFGVLNVGNLKPSLTQTPSVYQDKQVRDLQKLSPTDDVSSIESDLNQTNVGNLDNDLNQVDQSLKQL